ncbi:ABC transporter substrate-binding protein [Flexivirga meconopsidis]|uniref:ABC transporter substrate-binding protein n=1 Tax=Flexivirga meconopsidis TaxID=2977121 RepID=UPI002240543F|nr:extracellular solute-binding protein [Flexivirga meconopsidis]
MSQLPPTRRQVLRWGLLGAAGAATSGALAGCGLGSSDDIRFLQNKPEVIPYFDKLTAQFNSSQRGVRASHDPTTTPLTPQFVRGTPPDLACYNYQLEAASFLARGALSDLSDLPEAKTIAPSVQALVGQFASYKGQTSVLPYSVASAGVIYNKELFAKHDVAVPTTWSELISACKKFQAAGVTPIYFTFLDGWTLLQGIWDYVSGGTLDVAAFFKRLKDEEGKVDKNSPASFSRNFGDACHKMVQLYRYRNANAPSLNYNAGNTEFAKGKAAMYLQGPWALTPLAAANPKLQLGSFALPCTDDRADTKVRVNLDLALWIPNDSSRKEQARTMLQWLMRPEVMNAYNKQALATSPTVNAPPLADPRVAGLSSYVQQARFYQGASTYISMTIPLGNYIQTMLTSGDVPGLLNRLDTDWANRAARSAAA